MSDHRAGFPAFAEKVKKEGVRDIEVGVPYVVIWRETDHPNQEKPGPSLSDALKQFGLLIQRADRPPVRIELERRPHNSATAVVAGWAYDRPYWTTQE